MSSQPPTGTVTFLFSDIEGSTRLWELYPERMKAVLARHDSLIRRAVEINKGIIVKTTGDGCHAVFATAASAVAAALAAQQAIIADPWKEVSPQVLRVRMGLHTGESESRAGDYYGPAVNRAARLTSAGHGGQVLISAATVELMHDNLPSNISLLDLGEHRLKDLTHPEHIFQLVHSDLPVEFPNLITLDEIPNNLPIQPTSFIGREKEIAETQQMLIGGRLLTLTGSGGVGKTRLALQLAAELLPSFPDGVWLVELASLKDPYLVVQTVASALGLRDVPGTSLQDLLSNYLRGKRLLLVLDNCEHLVEECAQLVDRFLHSCPQIKILISSREALGIAGEVAYNVPSLSQPNFANPTLASLAVSEAVQLFLDRAQAAHPHFRLTEDNALVVAQICHRLDGIPLALELAAARVKVFSPEQIAARLDDRFRLLTGGSRTALPRQQTLRALIDWSYDLLSSPERDLLQRLSVFVNGWTFEAVEAVCPDLDVLDLLPQLVNKSLVIAEEPRDQIRYRLLETIRQYARDRLLESGDVARVRDLHFDYCLKLSEAAEPGLRTSAAFDWMERLDPDFDNIRAALEWGREHRSEDSLRLVGNLRFVWPFRFERQEALHLIQPILSKVSALPAVEANAANYRNQLLSRCWHILAMLTWGQGDHQSAMKTLERAIALSRSSGDSFTLGAALGMFSMLQFYSDHQAGMKAALEESTALFNQTGNQSWVVMTLPQLALIERQAGNWEVHQRYMEQAQQVASQFDHPMLVTYFLGIGIEARVSGNLELARDLHQQGAKLAARLKSPHFQAALESELVHLTRKEGKLNEAEQEYRRLIKRWMQLGERAAVANQLEILGFIARAHSDFARAACLLGAAEKLREEIQVTMTVYERPEYEQEVANLQSQMSASEFESAWAQGRALSLERAVEFAVATEPII